MDQAHHSQYEGHNARRSRWILVGFLAVAAFFLWAEHRAHLLGILPYLLVLACPLMHLFHHGHGHGNHGSGVSSKANHADQASTQKGERP